MAEGGWYTISEAAEILDAKYDTVQKRTSRYMQNHPESGLVRDTDPGSDGGKRNVLLSTELVSQWSDALPIAEGTARERFLSERLAEANSMLFQEREKRIADAEAKVADLETKLGLREMELADVRNQLRSIGSAFSQVVTDLTS